MSGFLRTQLRWLAALTVFIVAHSAAASTTGADAKAAAALGIDPDAAFSATRVLRSDDISMSTQYWQDGLTFRQQMQHEGIDAVLIHRGQDGSNTLLLPSMRSYMALSSERAFESNQTDLGYESPERDGRERVNGADCTRYKVRFQDPNGKRGDGLIWVSDAGIVMKADMTYSSRRKRGERLTFEMHDVRIEPQDPSLFTVPSDYQPLGLGGIGGIAGIDLNKSQTSSQAAQQAGDDEPGMAEDVVIEVGEVAVEETRREALQETREAIRRGFGRLFRRGKD